MQRRINILIVVCTCISITSLLTVGQGPANTSFSSISRAEVEILLTDVGKTNPNVLKHLANDPEARKQQIENLKQLLAFASQAQRDGMADEPTYKQELESIRAEVIAVNYDREINKDKPSMPPFGYVTDQQVAAYWADKTHENGFNDFLNAKIKVLQASNPDMKGRAVTADEMKQARDSFARIRIYNAEYERKVTAGEFPKSLIGVANLQVKLQQAQFLARLYADKVADQLTATDKEVADYVKAHRGVSKKEARSRLEKDKEQRLFDELIRKNNIQVPDDFTVPTITPNTKNQ